MATVEPTHTHALTLTHTLLDTALAELEVGN